MLPLKEKDRPIVKKLLEAGCCARCVLRFCCLGVQSDTAKELCAFISDSENNECQDAAVLEQHTEDPPSKKIKMDAAETDVQSEGDSAVVPTVMEEGDAKPADVCAVCLGVLQEFCDEAYAIKVCLTHPMQKKIISRLNGLLWGCLYYANSISTLGVFNTLITLNLLLNREKSICLDKDDVIQVKEAFKWTMQGLVSKELGGVPVVTKFVSQQNVFTRMAVVKALEKVSDEKFLKKFPCPPTRPARKCIAQDAQCLHVSVFVAGRYNKFSRTLPQTPWVIDGERRMESSVEELIAAPLLSSFRAEGFNFSSSGREDVDVRTLGNGRPFALELLNPHRARFNKAEVRQLQESINQSSDKIRVRDLQIVSRDAMGHMKEGEEDKTKSYTALIWTQKAIDKDDITFLEETKELKLAQKTPLRVLHRRPLAVRERVIHTMSTCFLDTHHFHLKLRTQAGTYIKEFVHGDFGRTKPNLCDLLKTETDILELDVDSVDVDWPPSIPDAVEDSKRSPSSF
uniref:tRNA pseudouridine(55) synthase n=1 Tax=Salmo trutta TaxID=8032 RepID=A0A674D5T5_SALTR